MPQIFHVHAKFYDIDADGEEPAMDIPRIVRQFVDGGYEGYLSSEWEGHAFSDLGESRPDRPGQEAARPDAPRHRGHGRASAPSTTGPTARSDMTDTVVERPSPTSSPRSRACASRSRPRTRLAQRAEDRGQVENLFNRYMYLHNAFQDEQIIPLWVKEGTEGIRARYTNAGQYTTWESVTRYHRDRPHPRAS